mmetsp:Transcript_90653/g.157114  ORF Transcript_90653/g.157114 Transcript_90653/m.157114 type:complete len:295 (-) Transcript_90653:5-889(-)
MQEQPPDETSSHAVPSGEDEWMRHDGHDELRKCFHEEQNKLRSKVVEEDAELWLLEGDEPKVDGVSLRLVGGVDLSFVKGDDVNACAALVVLEYPSLKVVYEDYQMVQLTVPYLAGYLAFREVPFLLQSLENLRSSQPMLMPQILIVDGNGILHPRGVGLASHLGVLCSIPTIGVAKTFLHVDGMTKNDINEQCKPHLLKAHDWHPLQGASGRIWGAALRSTNDSTNPIFVTVGSGICLSTALRVVCACIRHRIPEPVRWADLNSREYLRQWVASGQAEVESSMGKTANCSPQP